ncbi:nuclear hormone receptor HR96-like [Oppia nitens]|uniref:nuclear hormone receptor HR96-like n=1 Tax=Oppia nitens TaxID=1686743 RepID=UPI0023D9EAA9|nr:nuclear hormone receptor HR96-like [Oppia nitens]
MGMKQELVNSNINRLIKNNDINDLDIKSTELSQKLNDDIWYEFANWLNNNDNNSEEEEEDRESSNGKLDKIEKNHRLDDTTTTTTNVSNIAQPKTVMVDYEGLNQLQVNRINELITAGRVFRHRVSKNIVHLNNKEDIMQLSRQRTEESIREIIAYAKRVQSYTDLCTDDQLILVRYGSLDQLIVRMVDYFDTNINNFVLYIDSNTSLTFYEDTRDLGPNRRQLDSQLRPVYMKFLTTMLSQCRNDPIITELLSAIVMFNPYLPDLEHRHTVKLEQQLYIYLLQRYLQWKYRFGREWEIRLQTIMNTVMDVRTLGDIYKRIEHNDYRQYITKYGPEFTSYYGPLAKEIYNFLI